ncbi:MAG: hypothetical protein LBM75_07190 [Myxococcales bacterium]|jgi:hypothetical protein|nr:hypothetical protein [Myxococcales bacterium]
MKSFALFVLGIVFSGLISINCHASTNDPEAIHDRGKQVLVGDLEIRAPTQTTPSRGSGALVVDGGAAIAGALTVAGKPVTGGPPILKGAVFPFIYQRPSVKITNQTNYTGDTSSLDSLRSALTAWMGLTGSDPFVLINQIKNSTVDYSTIEFEFGSAYSCTELQLSAQKPNFGTSAVIQCTNGYFYNTGTTVAPVYEDFCANQSDDGSIGVLRGYGSPAIVECFLIYYSTVTFAPSYNLYKPFVPGSSGSGGGTDGGGTDGGGSGSGSTTGG